MLKKTLQNIFVILFIITASAVCLEEELGGCVEDLDKLGKAVSDASKAAEEAESAREELESKNDELKKCLENPDVASPTWDNGQSLRLDCELLRKNHEEKLKILEAKLKILDAKIKSVEWSCGTQFNNDSIGKSKNTVNVNCEIFKSLKGKIPIKELLDLCKKSMSEAECKKCLEIE
ncbi:MAG: hypothetical protein PHX78_08435 [bacterium]|nr:hypothetical protein [bacterium]